LAKLVVEVEETVPPNSVSSKGGLLPDGDEQTSWLVQAEKGALHTRLGALVCDVAEQRRDADGSYQFATGPSKRLHVDQAPTTLQQHAKPPNFSKPRMCDC
jgi:hypothetical protein